MREWLIKWMYREPVITWSLIIGGGGEARLRANCSLAASLGVLMCTMIINMRLWFRERVAWSPTAAAVRSSVLPALPGSLAAPFRKRAACFSLAATAYAGLKDVMGWHKERRHPATTWPY